LTPGRIVDLAYSYTFPVAAKWRALYAPGVMGIREHVCVAEVPCGEDPRIDPREHDAWQWSGFEEAVAVLLWPRTSMPFAARGDQQPPDFATWRSRPTKRPVLVASVWR